jgi:hypothetical protein
LWPGSTDLGGEPMLILTRLVMDSLRKFEVAHDILGRGSIGLGILLPDPQANSVAYSG